jgi:iron complex transport system ATP-binding protein
VIVTHHIEEIPVGTTHALLLKDGLVAVSGPVEQVVTSEHISAVFGVEVNVTFDGSRFFARATP